MFPICWCGMFGEKPPGSFPHGFPFDHSEAIFLVNLDRGERNVEGARGPNVVEKLVEDGKGLCSTLRAYSKLPHCQCESRDFSSVECQKTARDTLPKKFPHLNWSHFFGWSVAFCSQSTLPSGMSVETCCASVNGSTRHHRTSSRSGL